MNISIKQLSKQASLVALLSLPFSPSLEAAGWFDAVCNSRIGQWFSEQPKAAQIGLGVGALAGVAATAYCGYRYFSSGPILPPIDLSMVNINELSGYRVYEFGKDAVMLEQDINDITSVLKESDTTICSTQDKRYLFPKGWLTEREHVAAVPASRELKSDAQISSFGHTFKDNPYLLEVEILIMRNTENEFVGFASLGKEGLNTSKKKLVHLFVAPNFRRHGHAITLLAFAYQRLQQEGIAMEFCAFKTNPACRLYGRLVGFSRQSDSADSWCYRS